MGGGGGESRHGPRAAIRLRRRLARQDQRARRQYAALRIEIRPVHHMHGHERTVLELQIEIEGFGARMAWLGGDACDECGVLFAQYVRDREIAILRLRHIAAEPGRQRGVEVVNLAIRQRREESGGREIEIGNDELQAAEGLLLARAIFADVGQAPERVRMPAWLRHRCDREPEPCRFIGMAPGAEEPAPTLISRDAASPSRAACAN